MFVLSVETIMFVGPGERMTLQKGESAELANAHSSSVGAASDIIGMVESNTDFFLAWCVQAFKDGEAQIVQRLRILQVAVMWLQTMRSSTFWKHNRQNAHGNDVESSFLQGNAV